MLSHTEILTMPDTSLPGRVEPSLKRWPIPAGTSPPTTWRRRGSAPNVGRMTVYRTLDLLTEMGLVRPIFQGARALFGSVLGIGFSVCEGGFVPLTLTCPLLPGELTVIHG